MNYPVWELYTTAGGFWIATIAVIHVYMAHFAVGGGLLLVLTEIKARRTGSAALLDYTRRHAKFFMLITMVGGGVTGVGIWFTIGLLNPSATSLLIHTYVFGWATEWVCFAGEIVALLVYYYAFDRMAPKDHLKMGWLYFIFAWLSLFWVNGIIDFMLTPGRWPETGRFWDGFFNPTMLPALGFRTALALVLAGVFGLATASWMKGIPEQDRKTLTGYHARWLVWPMGAVAICGVWYWQVLPEQIQTMVRGHSPELGPYFKTLLWVSLVLTAGGALALVRLSKPFRQVIALLLLCIGLLEIGAFEFLREGARRPYVIYGQIYANSIAVADKDKLNRQGFLKHARWVSGKKITEENGLTAGREIFRSQCSSCHSVGGPMNDILPLTRKFGLMGMESQLNGQGKLLSYMPPFMGTPNERRALAGYIVQTRQGRTEPSLAVAVPPSAEVDIPPFDEARDEYILLAWSALGMYQVSDCDAQWSLAPPGATLYAQVIRRGETPEIVTEEVTLHYEASAEFQLPSRQVPFWHYAEKLYGRSVPPDTGLQGNATGGTMAWDDNLLAFVTNGLPLVPYTRKAHFNPYPLVTVEAREAESGRVLARTTATVPVSTELGCRNCHGGAWRVESRSGISERTAKDVLMVHDRINKTQLKQQAAHGNPVRCQSCHSDPLRGEIGRSDVPNLSAAIHGFHALYLTDQGAEACNTCHPGDPLGATRMLRGIHNDLEMNCLNCHGPLEDHALGLLKAEAMDGKQGARRLMALIKPRQADSLDQVPPRTPWFSQPDCLDCHVDFEPPDSDETTPDQRTTEQEVLFRMRADDAGIMCAACHGSPHALYPARNPYDARRDIIGPMQYQQSPYPMGSNKNCMVCHTIEMEEEIHHPNMWTEFRNVVE